MTFYEELKERGVVKDVSSPDLEEKLNDFLSDFDGEIVDIKFQVSVSIFSEEQIYCFSVMIIYK